MRSLHFDATFPAFYYATDFLSSTSSLYLVFPPGFDH